MARPFPVKQYRIRGATITARQARAAIRQVEDKQMSRKPPKDNNESSLLEQAATGARDAKDLLDELVIDASHAEANFRLAEATFLAARREREVANDQVNTQRRVYFTYLDELRAGAMNAASEISPNGFCFDNQFNPCAPEGSLRGPY